MRRPGAIAGSAEREARPGALYALLLALLLATSWVYAIVGAELRHTLSARPAWQSTKVGLERDVIGARSYVDTPMALAGDRLNLGAWHGFQEVLFARPVELGELGFRIRVSEDAHASVVYDATDKGFSGFRLSRNARYPSIHFRADREGRFERRDAIEGLELADGWHAIRLVAGGERVALEVDGRRVASAPRAQSVPGRLGFRGSLRDVYVDDVEIRPRGGEEGAYADSFSRARVPARQLLAIFAVLVLVVVGGTRLLAGRRPPGQRERFACFSALSLSLVALLVGALFLVVEELYLSERHGYSALHFRVQKKVLRPAQPSSSWRVVLPALRERYGGRPSGQTRRVFLIGTSQSWGSGASEADRDIAARLESLLAQRHGAGRYEVVNASVSGKTAAYLYEQFEGEWIDWEPSLVLINLGNNDGDSELLREKLRAFVALGRRRGAETVLVLEANHPESANGMLLRNHQVIREVGAELGVEVIDLHGPLQDHYDEGFLWWDFVHLTDYGQRLAAELLAEGLGGTLGPRD